MLRALLPHKPSLRAVRLSARRRGLTVFPCSPSTRHEPALCFARRYDSAGCSGRIKPIWRCAAAGLTAADVDHYLREVLPATVRRRRPQFPAHEPICIRLQDRIPVDLWFVNLCRCLWGSPAQRSRSIAIHGSLQWCYFGNFFVALQVIA